MRSIVVAVVAAGICAGVSLLARQQRPSIQARSGDVVVVEGDDRVAVVRRRDAQVLALYDPKTKRLTVMLDYAGSSGKPDGGVDVLFRFQEVTSWHLGERWTGPAVAEEYTLLGEFGGIGLGLRTAKELIQFTGPGVVGYVRDPSARHVFVQGTAHAPQKNESFALTEERLAEMERNAERRRQQGLPAPTATDRAADPSPPAADPAASQPVRVGGTIKQPAKIVHVDAVPPPAAVQAGARGMVVVEIVIGKDGSVTDARVLRSIPLLDEAALAAVRQWKYTPTLLNGVPVPVIMTATVNFQ